MNEFDLIKRYFQHATKSRSDVDMAIGDDGGVISPRPDSRMAVTTDTLISSVHFSPQADPVSIGHKSLAVNLSDLAAMGAEPAWCTLSLSLPEIDSSWLQGFASGFSQLANQYNVQLIGGDTCRGPLSITILAMGYLSQDQVLLRSQAQVGDLVYVSGQLGDAGLAYRLQRDGHELASSDAEYLAQKLNFPKPQIELGLVLRNLAHSAIDLSDGLKGDLAHILEQSQVGARIYLDKLPLSDPLQRNLGHYDKWDLALAAGDDYELLFTIPKCKQDEIQELSGRLGICLTEIGEIVSDRGVCFFHADGEEVSLDLQGYRHF